VRDIFERLRFAEQVDRLAKAGLLYKVTERFSGFPLHPDQVSNHDMGLAFKELIRKFAEVSNETAGEHFTPRDVIRLMVNLLFIEDSDILRDDEVLAVFDVGNDDAEIHGLDTSHEGVRLPLLWHFWKPGAPDLCRSHWFPGAIVRVEALVGGPLAPRWTPSPEV